MLHLNLPAPTDGIWTIFWRKGRWLLLGIIAPELPMLIACGQWSCAQHSVQEMRALGFNQSEWSLTHAFFVDSGGIVLQLEDQDIFPISAKQLAWLIQQGYTTLPGIERNDILDKSKAETSTKILAFLQMTWFMIQIIVRMSKGLPVTPIELASAAIALTSLTTLFFWMEKPKDVYRPFLLRIDMPSSQLTKPRPYDLTTTDADYELPLEYIEPRAYIPRKWSRRLLSVICRLGLQKQRMTRIPNDRDPQILGMWQHIALGVATASFACIHFLDWKFPFATETEAVLWRVSCCIMSVLLGIFGTTEVVICCAEKYSNLGMDTSGGYKLRWPSCLWFHVPATMYLCARVILVAGVLLSMRSLPEDAFLQVQWTSLLPHI